ncbi:MAG: hypothetical protein M3Z66_16825 [Chloroflexota bacterium]|nr:hypothetical protein [Chloroflexota bacterium]
MDGCFEHADACGGAAVEVARRRQRQERAAYDVARAARQYHEVEPENRLVARTLERDWEEQLVAQQQLDEEYHPVIRRQPRLLTVHERDTIRRLAADIPALWTAPPTTVADRKEIIRQVVERDIGRVDELPHLVPPS